MKYLKTFENNVDPFQEEDWEENEEKRWFDEIITTDSRTAPLKRFIQTKLDMAKTDMRFFEEHYNLIENDEYQEIVDSVIEDLEEVLEYVKKFKK